MDKYFPQEKGWDRTNIKIGLYRVITVMILGPIYFNYCKSQLNWTILWSLWLLYAALWIPLQGKHSKETPNFWTFTFIICDVFFLLLFSVIEYNVLENYSAVLIIPLFQYLIRYGRKTAFAYVFISIAVILHICISHYEIHPVNHIIVAIIMLLIVSNEGLLIQENKDLRKQLYNISIYDELTGLYNYRFFTQIIKREINRANRYRSSLTVLLIDIDYFKRINDSYGHEKGNIVLKGVAEIIAETVRDADVAARYGGEEFVVILPETTLDDGYHVAERIRRKVAEFKFEFGKVTISAGVASCMPPALCGEQVLKRADMAMYSAKKNGRNRVEIDNIVASAT